MRSGMKETWQIEVGWISCRKEGGEVGGGQEVSWCVPRKKTPWLWCRGCQLLPRLTQASGGRGRHGAEQASWQTIGTGSKEGKGSFRKEGRLAHSLGLWQDSHTAAPETTHCRSITHPHFEAGREKYRERKTDRQKPFSESEVLLKEWK